jgi:hypothetical protein
MPLHFSKYWYKDEPSIHKAGLRNTRDLDISVGGQIDQGQIVPGQCGFAVAEVNVPGFRAQSAQYLPNRCVEWHGHFLTCMALDGLPVGKQLKGIGTGLRHKQFVVAELPSQALIAYAKKIGLPILQSSEGRNLVNLEIYTVSGRTPPYSRATLL